MSKVYIVTSGSYSDYGIDRVFKDKRKAEIWCAEKNTKYEWDEYRIEEYEYSDDKMEYREDIELVYRFFVHSKYDMRDIEKHGILVFPTKKVRIKKANEGWNAIIELPEDNPEKAFKIAQDMFAMYKANKELMGFDDLIKLEL